MRYMRLFLALLFAFCLSLNCVMLNLRQNIGGLALYSFERALRNEIGAFLGGAVWLKMDKYGHYGENLLREMDESGKVRYTHQPFVFMKEFDPMMDATLRLEPEFSERVALYANSLAFNRNEIEKAREILQRHIIHYPLQSRLYRLYGEMGLIASALENAPDRALRYFSRAFQELSVLPVDDLNWEDWFNIRYYGLSASMAAYELKDLSTAYAFHRAAFFVEGDKNSSYQRDMDRLVMEYGHEQLKAETLLLAERLKARRQTGGHEHEHGHQHEHAAEHEHQHEHHGHVCTPECNHESVQEIERDEHITAGVKQEQENTQSLAVKAENLRKREQILRERFIYMLPAVNKQLFFPITSRLFLFFLLAFALQMAVFFSLKKSFKEF